MKSRNQREGVYCGRIGGSHVRYGSATYGFKHHPLAMHLRVRYISNVIGKIEQLRFMY